MIPVYRVLSDLSPHTKDDRSKVYALCYTSRVQSFYPAGQMGSTQSVHRPNLVSGLDLNQQGSDLTREQVGAGPTLVGEERGWRLYPAGPKPVTWGVRNHSPVMI